MLPILLDLEGKSYGLPNPQDNPDKRGDIECGYSYREIVPSYEKFPRRELNLKLDESNDGNIRS